MFIPLFNTPENYKEIAKQKLVAQGVCLSCNASTFKKNLYCQTCNDKLFYHAIEGQPVRLKQVGLNVINYQQYLHTCFFKCNVFVDYRGIKEDRIKVKIDDSKIEVAAKRISNLYSKKSYVWLDKRYRTPSRIPFMYESVSKVRNYDKRVTYNLLLFLISYHIENNKDFGTHTHFQVSLINSYLSHLNGTYFRTQRKNPPFKSRYPNKYYYYLDKELNSIIKPLLHAVIESIY